MFATSAAARHTYSSNQKYADDGESQEPALPFTGPSASFQATEAQKHNLAAVQSFQSTLSLNLHRSYRSPETVATELLPYVLRMLAPEIKPVIIKTGASSTASVRRASERLLVSRAVNAMFATGIHFEKTSVEVSDHRTSSHGGWIYRMEPALDEFGTYESMGKKSDERVRFGVRQVLEMEWVREGKRKAEEDRKRRGGRLGIDGVEIDDASEPKNHVDAIAKQGKGVKRDFFGRIIQEKAAELRQETSNSRRESTEKKGNEEPGRIWVSFHEGFSNAVRKPITLKELMDGL